MLVLAADTSLAILSVALLDDDQLVGAMALEGKGSRNEKLLPAIDFLLAENGVERQAIDLFAVTRGPGSFTGVRIGLATLQGMALALRKPVCAISTHEAAAHGSEGRVLVYDDAGRAEYYLSVFQDGRETVAPRLATAAERDELTASIEQLVWIPDLIQRDNLALRCARRAAELERSGEGARYRDVTPIYVRLAEAEVKLQQKGS
ncbi:MAG TPA: tRNA (adenosine(37)-N6)-threonylcarbamoyltransferase complex dimerization subunit type 1 TsaB [Thermoanaerobaculia bacterium]